MASHFQVLMMIIIDRRSFAGVMEWVLIMKQSNSLTEFGMLYPGVLKGSLSKVATLLANLVDRGEDLTEADMEALRSLALSLAAISQYSGMGQFKRSFFCLHYLKPAHQRP